MKQQQTKALTSTGDAARHEPVEGLQQALQHVRYLGAQLPRGRQNQSLGTLTAGEPLWPREKLVHNGQQVPEDTNHKPQPQASLAKGLDVCLQTHGTHVRQGFAGSCL